MKAFSLISFALLISLVLVSNTVALPHFFMSKLFGSKCGFKSMFGKGSCPGAEAGASQGGPMGTAGAGSGVSVGPGGELSGAPGGGAAAAGASAGASAGGDAGAGGAGAGGPLDKGGKSANVDPAALSSGIQGIVGSALSGDWSGLASNIGAVADTGTNTGLGSSIGNLVGGFLRR
ncbi:hypothetical protein MIR68_004906 [Amoeboaphelidium protococcarum]|nr:hypothetical protein MIR68_004906 [Amoeboaphelidium protococcarum]KAI3653304.1 hypothetical protein MP228_001251 [Amoeboaphelidium protococcarum]